MDLDINQTQRLVFCKYLLRQAEINRKKERPLSSFTVLILHDLVEFFLQVALEVYCPEERKVTNDILRNTAESINKKLTAGEKPVISQAYIKKLNEQRNPLKHSSIFIDQENIDHLYRETDNFITDYMQILFGKNFDEVSVVSLIRNQKVAGNLSDAEELIARSDFNGAMISIAKAFYELEESELKVIDDYGRNLMSPTRKPDYSSSSRLMGYKEPQSEVRHVIEKIEKDFEKVNTKLFEIQKIMSFGIDYMRYLKFLSHIPYMPWSLNRDNSLHFHLPNSKHLEEKEYNGEKVRFCFDFVIDVILKIEN